jgi:RHS repeat-associated protein
VLEKKLLTLAIDSGNNIYIAGYTTSYGYPTTSGAYDESLNYNKSVSHQDQDGFVSKLNSSLSNLLASTYIGGTWADAITSLVVDNTGDIFITGHSSFTEHSFGGYTYDYPYPTTTGAYNETQSALGDYDVFVSRLNNSLSHLVASTFIGGRGNDYAYSIVKDGDDNVLVAGSTQSSEFPTTDGAYDRTLDWETGLDGFVSKLTDDLLADNIAGLYALDEIVKLDPDQWEYYDDDAVNFATGGYDLDRTLLTVTGAQPVSFRIRYSSVMLNEGPLGKGWGHDYETRLEVLASTNIKIHWNANRENVYLNQGNNQYKSSDLAFKFDTLVKNTDGSYTLTKKDQTVYKFNSAGQLTEQKNSRGQSLTMALDANGRLERVTEPISGRYIDIQYNANSLIDKVTDSLNRQVGFQYDGNKNLTAITDAKGQNTTCTYNFKGQVLTGRDHEGKQLFANTYDGYGRIATQDDGVSTNQLIRYHYDENSQPGKLITTVTNRNGQQKVYTYNNKYQLLNVKDELGNIANTCTYDADGNRLTDQDALGRTTVYTYDSRGNMLTTTDPLGRTTAYTYDERNNLLTTENAAGKKTVYTYDANNNLISTTDPLNNQTTRLYDSNSLLLEKTMPRMGKTTYTYAAGQVSSITDPAGNTITHGYDAAGRLLSKTDGEGKTTTYTYDHLGNLLTVTDPLGKTKSYTYDCRNNKVTETDAKNNTTTYQYTGNDKLCKVINALNETTTYEYDGEDRLTKTTDAKGNCTVNGYDAKGRLVSVTDQMGNTSTTQYNAVDDIIEKRDAFGKKIFSATYDALHNPLTETDALNRTVTKHYDHLYRLDSLTDPLNRITRYSYDDLNRLAAVTDALNGISRQNYDADGNRSSLTDQNNNQTTFNHDLAGRLTSETTLAGKNTGYQYNQRNLVSRKTNARGQTTEYQYDGAGRLLSFTDPAGTVTKTYDDNGNVLTVTGPNGTVTREYDALNRLTKYTDARGNITGYQYDPAGNLATLTYPGGRQVTYGYDKANRLATVTDWAGRLTGYEYDKNGRLTQTTRQNGTIQTISYDDAGQVLQQKDIDPSGAVIMQYDFTYDAVGNVTTEQRVYGGETFACSNSYDAVRQLLQQKDLGGSGAASSQYDFTYDPGGNVTTGQSVYGQPPAAMTYAFGNRLATYNGQAVTYDNDGNLTCGPLAGAMGSFTYDARNRLTGAGGTGYLYDAENNRISLIESVHGSVCETKYIVNPNAALSQTLIKTSPGGSQTYYIYGLGLIGEEDSQGNYRTYHFDRRGSTVAVTDSNGNVADRFQYSPYGQLTSQAGTIQTPFLYNGRDGVMTDPNGLYYMRARYYSPEIQRFLNEDEFAGRYDNLLNINLYEYANNNPVMNVDPSGEFVPALVVGAAVVYKAWGAHENYQDAKGICEGFRSGDHGKTGEHSLYLAAGLIGGKGGKALVKRARESRLAGKVGTITKGAGKAGVIEQHHQLPRQFKKEFEKAGLDIKKYKTPMDKADHRLKPDGLHTGTNSWNKQWADFFKDNPEAKQDQILDQLDKMKKASGLK